MELTNKASETSIQNGSFVDPNNSAKQISQVMEMANGLKSVIAEINGQKVPLVLYGFGANDATDLVYYPSEDLAKQQSDVKYGDIDYKF